jgi:hypothetical protein
VLFLVNLGADEFGPKNALRFETVVATAEDPEMSLVVIAVNRKGPQVIDL